MGRGVGHLHVQQYRRIKKITFPEKEVVALCTVALYDGRRLKTTTSNWDPRRSKFIQIINHLHIKNVRRQLLFVCIMKSRKIEKPIRGV